MPPRGLVVCHHSTLADALRASVAEGIPDPDVVVLGRSGGEVPLPRGRAVDLSAALRRPRPGRYPLGLLVWPGLHRSWARGLLSTLPFALGARRVLAGSTSDDLRRLRLPAAVRDGAVFAVAQAVTTLVAEAAAVAIGRLDHAEPAPRPIARQGTALYLRTDVELAETPLLAGGSAAHTRGIVEAVQRRGHRVLLAMTGRVAGMPADAEERRLPVWQPANVPIELAELISGLLQARLLEPPEDTAFVYQRYSLNNLAGLLVSRRLGVPLVLEANASEAAWRRRWSRLRFGRLADAAERLLLARADRIAAVSENAAATLVAAGARAERVRVVPNAVDVERFATATARTLPFGPEAVVIAFCGLFYPWHGVRYLAEAFGRVHAELPQVRLLLVGDGEERALAEKLLRSGGALEAALITGLVPSDEVPGYLAAADVVVSPHAPDPGFIGSPIKLFEYLASGKAIVASRVAQLGEVLEDGQTGLLVPPGDVEALAAALLRLCRDPELRTRLGTAAQEEARLRHSWDARLAQILD